MISGIILQLMYIYILLNPMGRHRGREGKCMCNLCGEDVKVWVTFCGIAPFIQSAVHYF